MPLHPLIQMGQTTLESFQKILIQLPFYLKVIFIVTCIEKWPQTYLGCLLRKKTAKRGQKMALPCGIHYWCILTSPSDGDYHDSGKSNVTFIEKWPSRLTCKVMCVSKRYKRHRLNPPIRSHSPGLLAHSAFFLSFGDAYNFTTVHVYITLKWVNTVVLQPHFSFLNCSLYPSGNIWPNNWDLFKITLVTLVIGQKLNS